MERELDAEERDVVAPGADCQEPGAENRRAVREQARACLRAEDAIRGDSETLLENGNRGRRAPVDDPGDRPTVEQARSHRDLEGGDPRIDGRCGSDGRWRREAGDDQGQRERDDSARQETARRRSHQSLKR